MPTAYRGVKDILDILGAAIYFPSMQDEKDPRVIIPMPKALVEAVDDYRFSNRLPSRAEAIRKLLELGLSAAHSGGGA